MRSGKFVAELQGKPWKKHGWRRDAQPEGGQSSDRERRVHQFAEVVDQEQVRLLRAGAACAGDDQLAGGEPLGLAAAAAEEGDAGQALVLRLVQRRDDVGGVAARREHHDEVAGVAEAGDLAREDLDRVMNVNFIGLFHTLREGARVLRAQGLGGNIVVNSSKNVFGPGKDFGAYSASKAAGHQLAKVSAIELAADGIRVNMINPDAIFAEENIESGLWATVGPGRAQSRGMKLDELPEYYRSRNLLRVRVRARHVGNAVVFLASNQTPTTGASIPVDGGVVEAFPR